MLCNILLIFFLYYKELEIRSANKKQHCALHWIRYSVETKYLQAEPTKAHFDLNPVRFPPLFFSRVRSYCARSENPLDLSVWMWYASISPSFGDGLTWNKSYFFHLFFVFFNNWSAAFILLLYSALTIMDFLGLCNYRFITYLCEYGRNIAVISWTFHPIKKNTSFTSGLKINSWQIVKILKKYNREQWSMYWKIGTSNR